MQRNPSSKIFWDKDKCRGASVCDWRCLKDETAKPSSLCRSCDLQRSRNMPRLNQDAPPVTIYVNEKSIVCRRGDFLLDVLLAAKIKVPYLCRHPLLPPTGACRLCIVEISCQGKTRVATSCDFKVAEPISVRTDTPKIIHHRKMILEMLLAEAPDAPKLLASAREYGVPRPAERLSKALSGGKEGCIVCGRCVSVCAEVTRCNALDMSGRSLGCHPAFPFDKKTSESCTGCGACAAACPVGALKIDVPNDNVGPKCDICLRICPELAISQNPETLEIKINFGRCKECGLCIHYCPDKALHRTPSCDNK